MARAPRRGMTTISTFKRTRPTSAAALPRPDPWRPTVPPQERLSSNIPQVTQKYGSTGMWDTSPRYRTPCAQHAPSGTATGTLLTSILGLSPFLFHLSSSSCIGGTPLTRSPPDMTHVSCWIHYPPTQENGGHHPHPDGPIFLRIQKTLSSSVGQKPRITVEISIAASWKAPMRKGCER